MSIFEAASIGLPQISFLNRGTNSIENGLTHFKLIVLDILEFYGKEWPKGQIDSVSQTLFTEYYYWTLAEAKHFVCKLKAGHYQDSIENISSQYIVKAAGFYDTDLIEARKIMSDKTIKSRELLPGDVGPDKVRESLHKLAESLTKDIKAEKDKKIDETVGEGLLAEKRKATVAKNEDKLRELCKIEGWDFDQIFNQFK